MTGEMGAVGCARAREIDLAAFAVDSCAPAWDEFRAHYPRCAACTAAVAGVRRLQGALESLERARSAHPRDEALLAFASAPASLAGPERASFEAHLAGCAPCRTELAVLVRFDAASLAAPMPSRFAAAWSWLRDALGTALARPAFAAALLLLLATPLALWVWSRDAGERETQLVAAPVGPAPQVAPPVAEIPVAQAPAPGGNTAPPREQPAASSPELAAAESPAPAHAAPAEEPATTTPPTAAQTSLAQEPPAEETPAPQLERAARAPAIAPDPAPRAIQIAALLPSEAPQYAPGALAMGPSVRTDSVVRGAAGDGSAPQALAPAHVGRTASRSPTLYWLLPTATEQQVDVTLSAPDAAAPLLELTLPAPHAAGVHAISLAEHGVRLEPGIDYQWFVALVRDPERRSNDAVSGARIRYEPPTAELAERLAAAPPERTAHLYAEAGFWYDAFDQLSKWLAAEPGAANLRAHRDALLDQVGLRAGTLPPPDPRPASRG